MKLFHILPGVLLALSASRVYAGNVRYPYAINGKRSTTPRYAKRDECVQCIKPANSEIVAPLENIWKGLTDEEVQSVAQFLVTYSEFNITLSNPSANSTAPLSPNGTDSTQPAPRSQNSTSGLLGTDTLYISSSVWFYIVFH